ncbi:hypothetical protein ES703_57619 [subsurface metagenome]
MKKILKIFGITFAINLAENLLLLLIFKVPITRNTIIIAGIFSLLVSFIIDKFILQRED